MNKLQVLVLLLLVSIGCAAQGAGWVPRDDCQDTLTVTIKGQQYSKPIKDIFPEECNVDFGKKVSKELACLSDPPDQLRTKCVLDAEGAVAPHIPECGSKESNEHPDAPCINFGPEPRPETEDVPSIMVDAEAWECMQQGRSCPITDDTGKGVDAEVWFHADTEALKHLHLHRDSCADKSRVLLTSEDGKHHCVKFK